MTDIADTLAALAKAVATHTAKVATAVAEQGAESKAATQLQALVARAQSAKAAFDNQDKQAKAGLKARDDALAAVEKQTTQGEKPLSNEQADALRNKALKALGVKDEAPELKAKGDAIYKAIKNLDDTSAKKVADALSELQKKRTALTDKQAALADAQKKADAELAAATADAPVIAAALDRAISLRALGLAVDTAASTDTKRAAVVGWADYETARRTIKDAGATTSAKLRGNWDNALEALRSAYADVIAAEQAVIEAEVALGTEQAGADAAVAKRPAEAAAEVATILGH